MADSKRKTKKIEDEAEIDAATLAWKKSYAAFLKASDHSYAAISDILGVTKRMVKRWFEEEEMQTRVGVIQADMLDGALTLLQRKGIEMVEILTQNARLAQKAGSFRESTMAAIEALDRMGVTKVNKSESVHKHTDEKRIGLDVATLDQFEALPLETQHELAKLASSMESVLANAQGKE